MTVRRNPVNAPGLIARMARIAQLSATMPWGGRTHNYAATDLPWEDTACCRCGREFGEGDELLLIVKRREAGQIFTAPVHRSC